MKKAYEEIEINIWTCQNDVVTTSPGWQEDYDDTGEWKDTWNSKKE